jgi:hypothetical protein
VRHCLAGLALSSVLGLDHAQNLAASELGPGDHALHRRPHVLPGSQWRPAKRLRLVAPGSVISEIFRTAQAGSDIPAAGGDLVTTQVAPVLNVRCDPRGSGPPFRNLYVSMSRPTSFLCLAANECRVTPECAAALATKGWVVERLT